MVKIITRSEYRSKSKGGDGASAGTVRKLERSTVTTFTSVAPEWLGKHWAMWHEPGRGTVLGPVNVVPDPKPAATP